MILHEDFRLEAESVLAGLLEAYPQAGAVRIEVHDPEPGDLSLGNSDMPGVISLSGYWFSQPRDHFDEMVLASRAATPPSLPLWHGGIGGPEGEFERLITHEFGHHVMAAGGEPAEQMAIAGHEAAVADPRLAVSGYSLSDPDEWFAETFAASRIGGSGSPQVAAMLEYLDSFTSAQS